MTKKTVIIAIVFAVTVFVHYWNNHYILNYSRKTNELTELCKSKNDINLQLITVNSKLSSRDRIQKIARKELGMFFPLNTENIHTIRVSKKNDSFRLLDYFVPSVEALEN